MPAGVFASGAGWSARGEEKGAGLGKTTDGGLLLRFDDLFKIGRVHEVEFLDALLFQQLLLFGARPPFQLLEGFHLRLERLDSVVESMDLGVWIAFGRILAQP